MTPAGHRYPTSRVPFKGKDLIKLPTGPRSTFNRKANEALLQGNCHEHFTTRVLPAPYLPTPQSP